MNEKQYKTSQAQRNAVEEYRKRNGNPYTTISITLTREEAADHRKTLAEHNKKPVDVWRKAIKALKAEAIPTESATPNESPDGNTDSANG